MTKTQPVVFLFDVDNTLLENDSVQAHLKEHLEQAYGVEARAERSGVWRAVDDRVLIYIYKECELEYVAQLYPSDHYVLIDDKPAHPCRREENLGQAGDHGIPETGLLCIGS